MNPSRKGLHPASFRDPSGFIFTRDGTLYRQVNLEYREHYDSLVASGLARDLIKAGLLIPSPESDAAPVDLQTCYRILQPERVNFISYPYEWSFSQLQDAALVTLEVQKRAFEKGLALKDASAYNIQFQNGRPVLIDTLSFEIYHEGEPWVAYRQFCQHFLAPLALMALTDIRLSQLLRVYIDGIPLDLAVQLLPGTSRLKLGLLTHLYMHAGAQKRYAGKAVAGASAPKMSRIGFMGLIDNLESTVRSLHWHPGGTEWGDYYESTQNYSESAIAEKKRLVGEFIDQIGPRTAWDLGANTGVYSRIASEKSVWVVAFDIDTSAVEQNYLAVKSRHEDHLLPLILDLTNPSPGLGWAGEERHSLVGRAPVDVVLALALVHHLAISNNVPLPVLSAFLSRLTHHLIIEFVPKTDEQVQRLLINRKDIFPHYTVEGFEAAFGQDFAISRREPVGDTGRVLYLLER